MRGVLIGALGIAVAACGGGGSGTAAQPATAGQAATAQSTTQRTRGRADLITESEIGGGVAYQTALEVVQNLRPGMLIPRGVGPDQSGVSATSIPIVVYMDDVRLGDVGSMTNIPAGRVKEIRFLNARDATTRYGTGHSSGVILVVTKR